MIDNDSNLAQLMEVYDPTFIYGDKYLLENDEIFVKDYQI